MADLHAIREQLREARSRPAQVDSGSTVSPVFWIVAVFAAVVAFAIVLFTPRIYSVQRTASLPTFQETRDRLEAESKGEHVKMAPVATPAGSAQYAGKSHDEMGKIADDVCFRRAHAEHPHWSKTPRLTTKEASDFADAKGIKHFEMLLHCLVTEAPARYCSARQRTMITAEIGAYFRGIEHANLAVKNIVAGINAKSRSPQEKFDLANSENYQALTSLNFAYDPKVLTGIEGLIRAGYLTPADRGSFGALAPKPVKERLASVVANVSPCPKPPWWQSMWK